MARRSESQTIIVPFAVRLQRNGHFTHTSADEPILSNFDGRHADLLLEFDAFVRGLPGDSLVQRDDMHFGRPTDICREGRVLRWTMEAGQSGKERDIILTKGDTARKRLPDGVEYSSFHVYVVIPENSVTGWILVEKEAGDTLPSEWRSEFIAQFKKRYRKFIPKISQVRTAALWREVENAVSENRLLSVEVSQRTSDGNPLDPESTRGYPLEGLAATTLVYAPDQGGRWFGSKLRRLRRSFTTMKDAKGGLVHIDLNDPQDDFESGVEIKLRHDISEITARVLTEDGRPKTIRFSGIREPFESYIVEGLNGVRINGDRFAFECRLHATDLAKNSGVTLPAGWDSGAWDAARPVLPMEVRTSDKDQPVATVVELNDVRPGA
ncbi:hypothetical protein [Rhodococcus koreensis]|uniref:hypothetical protein n=1 Tax=Rhodococcus koreensis TaxID=99653 RepID=UPI00366CB45E